MSDRRKKMCERAYEIGQSDLMSSPPQLELDLHGDVSTVHLKTLLVHELLGEQALRRDG